MPWASSAAQSEGEQPRTGPKHNTRTQKPEDFGPHTGPGPAPSQPPRPITAHSQPLPRSTRANPFPKVTGPICRLPLPALFISSRGCSPRGPDADIGTPRRGFLNPKIQSRRSFKGRRRRAGRRKSPGALPVQACFSPQADSTQPTHSVKQKRQLCPAPSPACSPHLASPLSTSVCGNFNPLPFRHTKKIRHLAIATRLRNDSPMPNQCSHGTLPRFALQGSRLNTCYYHQDLH